MAHQVTRRRRSHLSHDALGIVETRGFAENVILEFGFRKPAFRIVVNTPTTHGSIAMTTGLDPSLTLGCGGYGGNITSDNISPRHLLNIKRIAYGLAPALAESSPAGARDPAERIPPAGPEPIRPGGISSEALAHHVDRAPGMPAGSPATPTADAAPADFVCEDDVWRAIRERRRILVGSRTIVTPAARDLAAAHRVFVEHGMPGS